MNIENKSWFCGNSPTFTLTCRFTKRGVHTHQEEGAASGQVNQLSVQQDLDRSPKEPKASVSVELEEGKHQFI
jgi:hypothetical protein